MTGIDSELFDRAVESEARRTRRARLIGFFLAGAVVTPIGYGLAGLRGLEGPTRQLAAIALGFGMVTLGLLAVKLIQWTATKVLMGFVQPGGRSRGPAPHSKAEALAASGRLDEAAAEFEATRAKGGGNIASLRTEAELHASGTGDPKRAEELFLRIRRAPDVTPGDELYASHRLIDLYVGPLQDPGRVLVELRRMADRFPDTVDGQGALAALKQRREDAEREAQRARRHRQ